MFLQIAAKGLRRATLVGLGSIFRMEAEDKGSKAKVNKEVSRQVVLLKGKEAKAALLSNRKGSSKLLINFKNIWVAQHKSPNK